MSSCHYHNICVYCYLVFSHWPLIISIAKGSDKFLSTVITFVTRTWCLSRTVCRVSQRSVMKYMVTVSYSFWKIQTHYCKWIISLNKDLILFTKSVQKQSLQISAHGNLNFKTDLNTGSRQQYWEIRNIGLNFCKWKGVVNANLATQLWYQHWLR